MANLWEQIVVTVGAAGFIACLGGLIQIYGRLGKIEGRLDEMDRKGH